MNRTTSVILIMGCALAVSGCAPGYYAYKSRWRAPESDSAAAVTKQEVIAMSKAGVGDDVIISLMNSSGSSYRMGAQDVIELADSGVSDRVIGAMIKSAEPPRYADSSGGYYYSPYAPWYYGYPYWYYPWYSSVYFGFWGGFPHPFYGHRAYFPRFHYSTGFRRYAGRGFGAPRSSGRHR